MTDDATPNIFTALSRVDLKKYLDKVTHSYKDKTGQTRSMTMTYVSWSDALSELLKRHPAAVVEVCTFAGPHGAQVPYCPAPSGYMVQVAVTVDGIRRAPFLPVMDHRHNAIEKPTARDIGDAHMRCLAKAIAMHGLGLYVYAGEDVPRPDDEPAPARKAPPARKADDERATIDDEAFAAWLGVAAHITDSDELGKHFSVLRKYRLTRAQVDAASACKTAREAAIAKAPAKKEQANAQTQQ